MIAKLYSLNKQLINLNGKLLALPKLTAPLIITIDTTKGNGFNSFTLPLTNSVTNCVAECSDGQIKYITNYLDKKITFTKSGIYTLKIRGEAGWSFNNTGDCQKLTNILSWGSFKFNYLGSGFYGCINLLSIPYAGSINAPSVTSLNRLFYNCVNLNCPIPPDLLKLCVSITDAEAVFSGCNKIHGSIPDTLLRHCTLVITLVDFFRSCISLTGAIPDDLLRYNVNLTSINFIFYGCLKLTSFTSGLFRYNTKLVSMYGVFFGCSGLDCEIPADLLRYNVNITTLTAFFQNCTKLRGVIPVDFLRYVVKVTTINQMFYNCNSITGFDNTLLIYMPLLKQINYLFYSCVSLDVTNFYLPISVIPNITTFDYMMGNDNVIHRFTGTIQDIWTYASPTATKLNAFVGQTLLINYPSIPNKWKGL